MRGTPPHNPPDIPPMHTHLDEQPQCPQLHYDVFVLLVLEGKGAEGAGHRTLHLGVAAVEEGDEGGYASLLPHFVLDDVVLVSEVCDGICCPAAGLRRNPTQAHAVRAVVVALNHVNQRGQRARVADRLLVLHLDGKQAEDEADVAFQLLDTAACRSKCKASGERWVRVSNSWKAQEQKQRQHMTQEREC